MTVYAYAPSSTRSTAWAIVPLYPKELTVDLPRVSALPIWVGKTKPTEATLSCSPISGFSSRR